MAYIENEYILKEESHNNKILSALNRMIKQLELNLNKRLLIVELPDDQEVHYKDDIIYKIDEEQSKYYLLPKGEFKLLCKGSDLTEEIAKGFIPIDEKEARIKHPKAFLISYKRFQNAFIDVVESNGWYWGENPEKKSHFNPEEFIQEEYNRYMEAESRTFNPEKCFIFEIL